MVSNIMPRASTTPESFSALPRPVTILVRFSVPRSRYGANSTAIFCRRASTDLLYRCVASSTFPRAASCSVDIT